MTKKNSVSNDTKPTPMNEVELELVQGGGTGVGVFGASASIGGFGAKAK